MTSARAWWKALWRQHRIVRRECRKARSDMMLFGTGYVRIDDKGNVNHVLPEAVVINAADEVEIGGDHDQR